MLVGSGPLSETILPISKSHTLERTSHDPDRVLFLPEFLGVSFDLVGAVGELFNVTVFVTDVDGRVHALLKATDVYLLDFQVGTEGVGTHVEAELFVFELFRAELSVCFGVVRRGVQCFIQRLDKGVQIYQPKVERTGFPLAVLRDFDKAIVSSWLLFEPEFESSFAALNICVV